MTRINLTWPRWANIGARLTSRDVQTRGLRAWILVRRTARLVIRAFECERASRRTPRGHRHVWARSSSHFSRCLTCPATVTHKLTGAFVPFVILAVLSIGTAAHAQGDEQPGTLFRALGLATYGVSGGDIVSTELALANGSFELNPTQRNRAVRITTHAVWAPLFNHTTDRLYRGGHKKTALWLRIGMVAAMGYATAHNLRNATR